MNILIVSERDHIVERIRVAILKKYPGVVPDVVIDALNARYNSSIVNYDIVIIDMTVKEFVGETINPPLIPANSFLNNIKKKAPLNKKVVAVFDESKIGIAWKNHISEFWYNVVSFRNFSENWEQQILDYI